MKVRTTIVALSIFLGFHADAASMKDVSFLSGCWSAQNGNMTTTESWTKAFENIMQGISQTKNSLNEVIEYEFLKIEKMPDGTLVYTPYVNGQQVPGFTYDPTLSQDNNGEKAVFTNAQNDFPTLISYSRSKNDLSVLNVRLEGHNEKNGPLVIEFPLFNISCNKSF